MDNLRATALERATMTKTLSTYKEVEVGRSPEEDSSDDGSIEHEGEVSNGTFKHVQEILPMKADSSPGSATDTLAVSRNESSINARPSSTTTLVAATVEDQASEPNSFDSSYLEDEVLTELRSFAERLEQSEQGERETLVDNQPQDRKNFVPLKQKYILQRRLEGLGRSTPSNRPARPTGSATLSAESRAKSYTGFKPAQHRPTISSPLIHDQPPRQAPMRMSTSPDPTLLHATNAMQSNSRAHQASQSALATRTQHQQQQHETHHHSTWHTVKRYLLLEPCYEACCEDPDGCCFKSLPGYIGTDENDYVVYTMGCCRGVWNRWICCRPEKRRVDLATGRFV